MAKQHGRFRVWPYQFVDENEELKSWLEARGMSILRLEGSTRCELEKHTVPRTAGRVRDELTEILQEEMAGASFNLVHVDRRETRGSLEIYYVSCYYVVSNNLLPQKPAATREEEAELGGR